MQEICKKYALICINIQAYAKYAIMKFICTNMQKYALPTLLMEAETPSSLSRPGLEHLKILSYAHGFSVFFNKWADNFRQVWNFGIDPVDALD